MRQFVVVPLLLFALSSVAAAQVDVYSWETDIERAAEKAAEEDKHLLVYFAGSDWCPYCQRLQEEVLTTETFASLVEEELVPVLVDFPRHRSQPAEQRKQNEQLARRLGVRGLPTLCLMEPENRVILAQMHYRSGGPEYYVEKIRAALQ